MVLSSLSLTLLSLFSPTQHSKSLSFSLLLLGPFGSIETRLLMRVAGSLLIRCGSWRIVVLKIMCVRHYGTSVNQGLPQPAGFLPPHSFHKINVNGASSDLKNSSSFGVVIRDSFGQVVAALSKPLHACFTAEISEMMALV